MGSVLGTFAKVIAVPGYASSYFDAKRSDTANKSFYAFKLLTVPVVLYGAIQGLLFYMKPSFDAENPLLFYLMTGINTTFLLAPVDAMVRIAKSIYDMIKETEMLRKCL